MENPEEISRRLDEAHADFAKTEEAADELSPIKSIQLDVQGSRKRWVGDFVFKVPTLADQVKIGAMKTAYLPMGSANDVSAATLVEQICYLEVTLQKKPDWWKPMEFYDATPVSKLYEEVTRYERRFHGERKDARANGEGLEGVEEPTSGTSAHVGRKVQPPAERSEVLIAHGA